MKDTNDKPKVKWSIDPVHSEIGFKVRHMMITNVKGIFTDYDASIYTMGEDFMTADVAFWLNPASIHSGDVTRDTHLKSADFFDIDNHDQIHFTSDDAYKKVDNDGSYEMWGDLTIKGIKQQIKLSIEFGGVMKDPWGNQKAGIKINGKINRSDWNLKWNTALEDGGVLVGDQVRISCEIQLVRQS